MAVDRSGYLCPRALAGAAALASLCPALARADGMDAMVGAAIAGALIFAGGLSVVGSILTLVVAIVYRRGRGRGAQILAATLFALNLILHAGFGLMLGEYAVVFVPGVALAVLAGWIVARTDPPVDEQGKARPVAGPVALTLGGIAAVVGLVYGYTVYAKARFLAAEEEAMRSAQATLHDPTAPGAERIESLRYIRSHFGPCDLDGLDLSGLDLSGLTLDTCSFVGTDLRGANLSEIYAIGADLSEADLRGVTLVEARLEQANMSGLDLRDVDLSGAQLADTDLSEAQLDGAVLDGAYASLCNMRGASVTAAQLEHTEGYGVVGLSAELEAEVDGLRAAKRAAIGDAPAD